MADEVKKGVIVEFDFAAMDGAGLLYKTTEALLKEIDDIPFNARIEAQHLAGGNYQGGKAAKDLADRFEAALNAAVPAAVTPAFKNFVKTLADKGVKVVISTRANLEAVQGAFADVLGDSVVLYQETAPTYGCVKWDAWRRACVANKLRNTMAVAVTGSGYGVKSALLAGIGSVAVTNDHVAYQDFGGADEVLKQLDAAAAKAVLGVLRV